ncbi:MAG: Type I signal peptidase [Candidatus Giovannonibacteria bacterium GW2011_GWC2_44_9]|uniref:Signal peptidase I n=2 Tax=Candidatus Giovannoniibacteriota TaxID=1752738 RepID=A0A0G1ISD6_9BACT|nr:MAG: Type I signal peptidase [Candidatus Giovannonibacteria bacterium GW2011_GWA1_44_29]KKT82996.1 MAG: Type I signal peptidase [Candidatus Giovannonibacteria bacterium GW2011_GWC2_44_9]KKT91145.1 MAG: Type I signal peptidase [Parcubacteria group bacterium GW2011_GWC1_45_13]KKU29497.1 MAG: Type I signal peptidase [Candidatus Giovannonibacteria bacterium GW2011_GWB1_46_20]
MINKIIRFGSYVFFGALIFVALVVVASAFPIQGNIQIKVVESGSMEPTIKTGSVVIVKPSANYAIGDVITFDGNFKDAKGQRVPVSHRIVEMKVERGNPIYITKGDANEEADTKEVPQSRVIGKVYLAIPYLGYAIASARTTYGFLALIIIPAAIIIWDQGGKILGEIKKMKGNKKVEENT